jgi:hypothetical protein
VDVLREFMLRISASLHGNLGSYLCDALQEGSADAMACLLSLWAFSLLSPFICLVVSTPFSCKKF